MTENLHFMIKGNHKIHLGKQANNEKKTYRLFNVVWRKWVLIGLKRIVDTNYRQSITFDGAVRLATASHRQFF